MIKYSLHCKNCDFSFESWFASSKEYEKLKRKNFLSCHKCNSIKVEKNLMAPSLISKKSQAVNEKDQKKYNKIRKTITEYQKFIKNNFEYVGTNFVYEARSIHYNEKKKQKGIYGSASKQELKELKDEGIDAQMIPWIEDKSN
jgi:hypothetical protein